MEDSRDIIDLYPRMSTPFGQLLTYFMERQHVSTAQVSKRMGVTPRVVSGLLSGARDNIGTDLVVGVSRALGLVEADHLQLEQAARFSQMVYRLPLGGAGWTYALAFKFIDNLADLSPAIARIIDSALDAGSEAAESRGMNIGTAIDKPDS